MFASEEDLGLPEEDPEPWRPPVPCPLCRADQTRFISLRYEMSVYVCEICGAEFEAEE